ncbi:hypothetical protein FB645_004413 [Coemansia sp. IMI 203386]|nr:hypothetical protein FB645_004413 [Coemansia sp. IMI 203386]
MFPGSSKDNSGRADGGMAAASQPQPRPIPGLSSQHSDQQRMQDPAQQTRRSSFAGWSQSLFGFSSSGNKMPGTAGFSPPTTYSMAGANSLPDNSAAAFSGIGLFRRFSTSGAGSSAAPPSDSAKQTMETPSDYRWPATASGGGLDDALGDNGHGWAGGASKERHHHGHLQPKVFEEIQTQDDPPSRPDSRIKNLMLSGQFLI